MSFLLFDPNNLSATVFHRRDKLDEAIEVALGRDRFPGKMFYIAEIIETVQREFGPIITTPVLKGEE